jgi:hypothetical protein
VAILTTAIPKRLILSLLPGNTRTKNSNKLSSMQTYARKISPPIISPYDISHNSCNLVGELNFTDDSSDLECFISPNLILTINDIDNIYRQWDISSKTQTQQHKLNIHLHHVHVHQNFIIFDLNDGEIRLFDRSLGEEWMKHDNSVNQQLNGTVSSIKIQENSLWCATWNKSLDQLYIYVLSFPKLEILVMRQVDMRCFDVNAKFLAIAHYEGVIIYDKDSWMNDRDDVPLFHHSDDNDLLREIYWIDETSILSIFYDYIGLWDARDGSSINGSLIDNIFDEESISLYDISIDKKLLAVVTHHHNYLSLFSVPNFERLYRVNYGGDNKVDVRRLCFSPFSPYLAFQVNEYCVKLFEFKALTSEELHDKELIKNIERQRALEYERAMSMTKQVDNNAQDRQWCIVS